MLEFIIQHPVVILYLAAGWFLAAIISAMPPYNGNNFWLRWLVNIAQIVGASLDKVSHVAQQTTAFKQVEQTLQTSDLSGVQTLENSKITTQTAEPTSGVTR